MTATVMLLGLGRLFSGLALLLLLGGSLFAGLAPSIAGLITTNITASWAVRLVGGAGARAGGGRNLARTRLLGALLAALL